MTLVALLFAVAAIPLSAQGGPGGGQGRQGGPGGRQMTEEDVERQVENLAETLEMTEEQQKKVLTFELESYTKMQVEREKNMGDRDAMRASMTKIREESNEKYKEVLSEKQYTKLQEIQEQRRSQRPQRDGQGGQGDRPERGRGRN